MTIEQLNESLTRLIKQGYGDKEIVFDSESMCFDTHLVGIFDCEYVPEFKALVLHFDPITENYHYNKN